MADKKRSISRRNLLGKTAKGSALVVAGMRAPYVFTKTKLKLRILGTHVTLQEPLRQQAMKDLGIELEFEPKGSAAVLQKAASNPESFDLYEQWSDSINILWSARAIQPIEIDRIKYWGEINPLTKTGKLTADAKVGKGDAPYKLLYVQKDNTLGSTESKLASFLPYVHNVDSFGYNTNFVSKGIPYETESWAWLLDERYKGKVALINAPTIGIFDAALAAEASGLIKFKDMGNMTTEEIDKLFAILTQKKQEGQFAGFWNSVPQSVEFVVNKRAYIESMFSPGVAAAKGKGVPIVYASPKEGYRAWHGVMCMSAKASGAVKDTAYQYMNWWLSGWPGAFIARQGYYISNAARSKPLLDKDEWNYWYGGKPAQKDLKNTFGEVAIKRGETRDGGSYEKRFSNIAIWNSVMDNYDYSLDKWYEFLNS